MTQPGHPERDPDTDDRLWRAEDLLRAVMSPGPDDSLPPGDAASPLDRIGRFLDGVDTLRPQGEPPSLITVTEGDRTMGFRIGASDSPPVPVPNHELLACVGVGGFGQVWLARSLVTEHFRACKLIAASHAVELDGIKKLKQRVTPHPNLFPIEEVGRAGDWLYVLMPLADPLDPGLAGDDPAVYRPMTLGAELASNRERGSRVNASIARDILAGMTHLHDSGVTHGDIKPGNILRLGGRWTLADYGLLRGLGVADDAGFTPGFVPPEGPGSKEADIFALGVVLKRMTAASGRSCSILGSRRRLSRTADALSSRSKEHRRAAVVRAKKTLHSIAEGPKLTQTASVAIFPIVVLCVAVAWTVTREKRGPDSGVQRTPANNFSTGNNNLQFDADRLDREILASLAGVAQTAGLETTPTGNNPSRAVPSRDDFVLDPKIVSMGHTVYAITDDGRVVSWGYDDPRMPGIPQGIVDPVHIATNGPSVIVVQADGKLVAWGQAEREDERRVPENLPAVIDVDLTYQGATIAVLADGSIRGWGLNWSCPGAGSGMLDSLSGLRNVRSVSGENGHWVYLTDTGGVGGRGCDWNWQLRFPQLISARVQALALESWSCLLDADGRIHTFGFRSIDWLKPPEGTGFVQIAANGYTGLALHESGRIVHWGDNRFGQALIPQDLGDVAGIACGGRFGVAIHPDGSLTMWGDNQHGQLDWPRDIRVRLGDPDCDRNGVPDWIDILRGDALDENQNGIPDHCEEIAS